MLLLTSNILCGNKPTQEWVQNVFLHVWPLHLLPTGVANRVKDHVLTMMETLTWVHYLLSIHFCTCWHSNLKSFQAYRSLTKKKKSSEVVPYLCIVNLVSKDPRAMNHSGHRRWALCNCECWTCEACWHWNAEIPLAEKGQHSRFHFN